MIYVIGINEVFTTEGIKRAEVEDVYEYFKTRSSMMIDIETSGKDPHSNKLISIQFGDRENQFFVDCRKIAILKFKKLLEEKECLGHNIKFEYKFLKKAGILIENLWDTMLAECILYAGHDRWGYGLNDLVSRYLNITMEKEIRSSFLTIGDREFNERQIRYGCLDVTYLDNIKEKQEVRIEELELGYCLNLENKAVKALGDIELAGIKLNSKEWLKISKSTQIEAQKLKETLDDVVLNDKTLSSLYKPKYIQGDLFGGEVRELKINYASPVQILKICHQLGYQSVQSTDEQHLTKLKNEHLFFQFLLELRGKNKIISTYGEHFLHYINPATSRIHTSFWQVQSTGRLSSGSKRDDTPNIQNIPADNRFRNCFVAREGYSWVSADYVSQELFLLCDKSQEPVFLEAISQKKDLHSVSASLLYGRKITKKDVEERTAAKTITFGLCYGMGYKKLANSLNISEEESKELFDRYERSFPTVMKWLNKAGKMSKRDEKAVTDDLCKRVRWFPDMIKAKEMRRRNSQDWKSIFLIEGATEREGKNHLIQGSAANITKEALITIRELIIGYNNKYKEEVAFLIGQIHDSIECEVRDDLSLQFSEEMTQLMREAGNKYLTTLKMDVDVNIDKMWKK